MTFDILVVGAGFAGSVCAERLASAGRQVHVIERRDHIGGNAHDRRDDHGILIHPYGPHIFHTEIDHVVQYLSRFTDWRPYEHRVLSYVDGELYPIPLNLTTINKLYDLKLDEAGVKAFFKKVREPRDPIVTSEDVVLNTVGRDLYEKFYRNYTRKQWELDPSDLSARVCRRIPVRTNTDDRYFTDDFQKMPLEGYARMFERILSHDNITVSLSTDFFAMRDQIEANHIVYTGPVDAYFKHSCGRIPYRSLRFEHEHLADIEVFQPVATVNYPNDHAFTRITEFKHLSGQRHSGTSVVREYPTPVGDPYYPVPNDENDALADRYRALAEAERGVTFVGRLAEYRYYNMDQTVDTALGAATRVLNQVSSHV